VPEPTVRNTAIVSAEPGSPFPELRARRCECGYVFCPPHGYGCERCGRAGEFTSEVLLKGRGVLTALATVHVHSKLPTPYGLGRVTLDEGPVLDVPLVAGADLSIGSRVSARLVPDASGEVLECRFGAEEETP